MPLFRSSRPDPVVDEPTTPPARHGSIFSSRRRVSPDPVVDSSVDNTSPTTRTGFFGRQRRSADSLSETSGRNVAGTRNGTTAAGTGTGTRTGTGTGTGTGFFGGRFRDASLDAAQGKVHAAELAEKEADKALIAARRAVVEAKRHVEILENEANEQARFAQQKVLAVRDVKSDAGHLGRHN